MFLSEQGERTSTSLGRSAPSRYWGRLDSLVGEGDPLGRQAFRVHGALPFPGSANSTQYPSHRSLFDIEDYTFIGMLADCNCYVNRLPIIN
jgi:hypothetical protein